MEKVFLTVPELAQILNVGRSTAYDLVLRGQIVSVKLGKCRRVPVSEVEKYVQRLVQESALPAA